MSVVKERASAMAEIRCNCGGSAQYQIDDVEHSIRSRKIILKNVPHFYCRTCKTASYGDGVNVSNLLRYAYMNKLDEVPYTKT